ncbi:MAG: hypothetical protein HOD92_12005 [Deltaproteobacteria bacterium]|nr:hypothetical protein [Deltaproteobacteria bacterium]
MNDDLKNIFRENLFECGKHHQKIQVARQHLTDQMPLTKEKYLNINDIDMSFIDQLIFRFSKLQDSMGEKIFPLILRMAGEEVKKKTFIDILNRMEELDIVDKNEWLQLREIRNQIAHEYSSNVKEVVNSIVSIFNTSQQLMNIYITVIRFCEQRFGIQM